LEVGKHKVFRRKIWGTLGDAPFGDDNIVVFLAKPIRQVLASFNCILEIL
jgi:hypothetical protein